MPVFPIGEWTPDQPALGAIGPGGASYATVAQNVIPVTAQSYGPVPGPIATAATLGRRCQGVYSLRDENRIVYIFAGDAANLYWLRGGETSFTTASGAAYNCPVPGQGFWRLTSFGRRVVATDYTDPVQTLLIGVDPTFSDLSAAAPRARYAAVIRDFLFLGNTFDPVDGARPSRVWWSAIGNPTDWPTPGTNAAVQVQSDFQDLQQSDLGEVTGIIGAVTGADGLVFCERGIYRVVYQGSPAIFSFTAIEGATGTRAPQSIVQRHLRSANGVTSAAYYLGEDGFYAHDGSSAVPIGADKINQWFFANLHPQYPDFIVGTADPARQIIVWAFPGTESSDGMLDRLLIYNWNLNRWSVADISATPFETLGRAIESGYTLDQLDPFGTVDTLPASLDVAFWVGGGMGLGGFDGSHRLVHMAGPSLAALVETVEMQPIPGRRVKVRNVRPLADGAVTTIATAHRERLSDAAVYEPAVAANKYGECPQFASGRYVRFSMAKPAGDAFTHIQGVDTGDIGLFPAGQR